MKINKSAAQSVLNPLLIFIICLAFYGFIKDILNTFNYGGLDQRNRIVGARLMMDGQDPYYTKWHEGDGDYFYDPCDYEAYPINRVTVPPTVLTLHALIAKWPHAPQRYFWAGLNWFLFLLSLFLLANTTRSKIKIKLVWMLGLLISLSWFWRMHIEVGQIYMLYTFLIILAFWLAIKSYKKFGFFSGFVIGLTVSLRPPVVVMGLPILILKRWRMLLGCIAGGLSGLAASFIYADVETWKRYFSAMKIHSLIHVRQIAGLSPLRIRAEHSQLDSQFNWGGEFTSFDTSIRGFIYDYLNTSIDSSWLYILFAVIVVMLLVFLIKNKSKFDSMQRLFLFSVILVLLFEYFMPAKRNPYNNVIWILPISLIILNFNLYKIILNPLNILLVTGLLFYAAVYFFPEVGILSDYAIVLYSLFTMIFFTTTNDRDFLRDQQKALLNQSFGVPACMFAALHELTGQIVNKLKEKV